MRTLRYILTGRPHSTEDCLDLAARQPPEQVELGVAIEWFPTDQTVWAEAVAEFRWRFPSAAVRCRETCGSYSALDAPGVRRRRIAGANVQLERTIEQIESRGIAVIGRDLRFTERISRVASDAAKPSVFHAS